MLDEKVYQHGPGRFTEEFWGSDDLSPQQPPTDCTLGVRQRDRAVRPMIARGLQTGVPEDMPRRGAANGLVTSTLPYQRIIASRSEEHTSELQSLMRTSYAVFCLKKKTI